MGNLLIEGAFAVTWQTPVRVRIGNGFVETIRGPEEGLRYLAYRWPAISGDVYHDARRKCVGALEKTLSCQAARDAFVCAAEEAEMLA